MEFKTTFWQDFTIADCFGLAAVKDTFNRAFREWRDDVEYLTELSIVLNWRLWRHYGAGNDDYARLYNDLWLKVHNYAYDHLTGDDLTYYWRMTD